MTRFWNLKKDADVPGDGVLDIDGEIVAEAGWFTPDGVCVAKEFRAAPAPADDSAGKEDNLN